MGDFWKRTVFGFLFVVVVIGCLYLGVASAFVLFAFIVLLSSAEISNLFPNNTEYPISKCVKACSLLFYFLFAFTAYFSFPIQCLSLSLIILILPLLVSLFSKKHDYVSLIGGSWLSMLFVALPCGLMMLFYNDSVVGTDKGFLYLILSFILIWVNDIFAYLTGSAIGRHKLFVRISPKKTIEGSVGGAVFTLLVAYLANRFLFNLMTDVQMLGLSVGIVIFGTLGDLTESMIKRRVGVKDSGNLIPGHGGILDRFDATFMAMPFVFTYITLLNI